MQYPQVIYHVQGMAALNVRRLWSKGNKPTHLLGDEMENSALKKLYLDELKDLYSAENQLIKALPKMAKAAENDDLRAGFEEHLEQTREHVNRLEKIFEELDESPKGKKCQGMEGLIEEGTEMMGEDLEPEELDAGLIAKAQHIEHYEIAGYGCVRTYANLLGETEAANLLEQTLEEEKETDSKLTELAEQINITAAESEEGEEEDAEERSEQQERPQAQSQRAGAKGSRKGKSRAARA
jgi:ferritin-like metal-binding protein YciE